MEEHVMKTMKEQLDVVAEHIEQDIISHIADLSVSTGCSKEELDNFQNAVEAKLCEAMGVKQVVEDKRSVGEVIQEVASAQTPVQNPVPTSVPNPVSSIATATDDLTSGQLVVDEATKELVNDLQSRVTLLESELHSIESIANKAMECAAEAVSKANANLTVDSTPLRAELPEEFEKMF